MRMCELNGGIAQQERNVIPLPPSSGYRIPTVHSNHNYKHHSLPQIINNKTTDETYEKRKNTVLNRLNFCHNCFSFIILPKKY